MTSISSPKATDDPFGLPPLTTCARRHVRTTALETEALALRAREFGTVCHVVCEYLTYDSCRLLNVLVKVVIAMMRPPIHKHRLYVQLCLYAT